MLFALESETQRTLMVQGKVLGGIMSFKWYYLNAQMIAFIDFLLSRQGKCFFGTVNKLLQCPN